MKPIDDEYFTLAKPPKRVAEAIKYQRRATMLKHAAGFCVALGLCFMFILVVSL